MVHLYALADHPARLPTLADATESPLAAAEVGGIDAVFGELEAAPADATEEAILAHAHVVEELAALNEALLPARLGAPYDSEDALLEAIRGRTPQLRDALEHVRGCVELGVRVVRPEVVADHASGSGSDYMRRRLAAVQDAERLAAELDDAVRDVTRDSAHGVTATSELVLSAAYLVPRAQVDRFRGAVEALADRHSDLTVVCMGPWPPYSFALVDGSG
jgi:hypothetical protein